MDYKIIQVISFYPWIFYFLQFVISFSLAGEPHLVDNKPISFTDDLLKFFLDSIGSTLPEVSEVELK